MKVHQNKAYITAFCVLGFFAGILYANIVSREIFSTSGIFSEYFLSQYPSIEIIPEEYIFYILQIRVTQFSFSRFAGANENKKSGYVSFSFLAGIFGGILIVSAYSVLT